MNKQKEQVFTFEMYGAHVKAVITKTVPETKLEDLPENLTDEIDYDMTYGEFEEATIFTDKECCILNGEDEEETEVKISGYWKASRLKADIMTTIAKWYCTRSLPQNIPEELFIKHFGESTGKDIYSKWIGITDRNIWTFIWQIKNDQSTVQTFCDILEEHLHNLYERKH